MDEMDWQWIISEIKKATSLNSSQLAKRLGVRQPYISDLENGYSKNPKTSFIKKIVVELNVSPNWLFREEGDVLEKERPVQMQYEEVLALKSLSAFDLIQIARYWARGRAGPGIKEPLERDGGPDQGEEPIG